MSAAHTEELGTERAEEELRRARRAKHLVTLGALVLSGAAIASTFAVVVNFMQSGDISRIEKSACGKSPSGKECKKVSREAAEARSIRDSCIPFWKVGYPCPAPDSGVSIPKTRRGDAARPAQAGQLAAPAGAGDRGGGSGGVDKQNHGGGQRGDGHPTKPPAQSQPPAASPPKSAPGEPGPTGPPGPPAPPPKAEEAPETPPGLLDPALGLACEKTQALNLCKH